MKIIELLENLVDSEKLTDEEKYAMVTILCIVRLSASFSEQLDQLVKNVEYSQYIDVESDEEIVR